MIVKRWTLDPVVVDHCIELRASNDGVKAEPLALSLPLARSLSRSLLDMVEQMERFYERSSEDGTEARA